MVVSTQPDQLNKSEPNKKIGQTSRTIGTQTGHREKQKGKIKGDRKATGGTTATQTITKTTPSAKTSSQSKPNVTPHSETQIVKTKQESVVSSCSSNSDNVGREKSVDPKRSGKCVSPRKRMAKKATEKLVEDQSGCYDGQSKTTTKTCNKQSPMNNYHANSSNKSQHNGQTNATSTSRNSTSSTDAKQKPLQQQQLQHDHHNATFAGQRSSSARPPTQAGHSLTNHKTSQVSESLSKTIKVQQDTSKTFGNKGLSLAAAIESQLQLNCDKQAKEQSASSRIIYMSNRNAYAEKAKLIMEAVPFRMPGSTVVD